MRHETKTIFDSEGVRHATLRILDHTCCGCGYYVNVSGNRKHNRHLNSTHQFHSHKLAFKYYMARLGSLQSELPNCTVRTVV